MWESVTKLVQSGEAWFVLIIIGMGYFMVKQGLLRVKNDKISLGKEVSEEERNVIKNQMDSAETSCASFEAQLPRYEGYDEFRSKYIAEKVYDEIIKWILFNHLTTSKSFVKMKQKRVWNIVMKYIVDERMKTPEFKKMIYAEIAEIIGDLVNIRKEYNPSSMK